MWQDLLTAPIGFLITFLGLGCLIAIVSLMGAICKKLIREESKAKNAAPVSAPASAPAAATNEIANRDELVAIFSAAVAEELGVGVDAIRVVSLKQVQ